MFYPGEAIVKVTEDSMEGETEYKDGRIESRTLRTLPYR